MKNHIQPDINITPLVDVVLVLLIIFMVIAPSLEHGERVELPSSIQVDPPHSTEPVVVTITRSNSVFLDKEQVSLENLKYKIFSFHSRKVLLKGDSSVSYEKIREVFLIIQNSGFSNISLQVQKKE